MLLPRIYFLKEDEQLLVEDFTQRFTVNGPRIFLARPFLRVKKRQGISLGAGDYLRVRNTITGEVRNELGPKLYFLAANEEIVKQLAAIPLRSNQYIKLIDKSTGTIRVERGEGICYLNPAEEILGDVQVAINIDREMAVLVRDINTGQLTLIAEPQVFIPQANQQILEQRQPVILKRNQYVKVINKTTGNIRVQRGECSFFLQPNEELASSIQEGINIDEHTAVLVRDIVLGQLELISEPQVFFPSATQEVIEKRKRILLEDHETVVIKNRFGQYVFRRGTDIERSFFLDPYSQLVEFCWSSGHHKEKRDLKFTRIDSRPKFMSYEFEVRTQDNVELIITITLFWQIVDIGLMIRATDDATGDICSHARSSIIQAVSQASLERFLAGFNILVRETVLNAEDRFYAERGVQIHAVEVRSIACKEEETQRILLEIIQETTNRLNCLQKQESSNEVKLRQLAGELEAEKLRGQLLELQRNNSQKEAIAQGEAEATRVKAFLDGLGEQMPLSAKMQLFGMLRKQDAIAALSAGSAQLYFTPAEVDLSIESRQNAPNYSST